MKRSVHDSLFRCGTSSTRGKANDSLGTPRTKMSTTTSRNSSVSAATSPPAPRAPRRCPVRLVYSVINDCSHVESEELENSVLFFNNTGPDDRDPTAIRLHADHVFLGESLPTDTMTQQFVESTVRGEDTVVALASDSIAARRDTFFHPENGLVASYCAAMISELEASGLSQLCAIRHTLVRISDDQLYQSMLLSGASDAKVSSLVEAEASTTHFVQTSSDVSDLLTAVNSASAASGNHVVLMLRVAPSNLKSSGSHILKGLGQLMKPLGCVCFVLLGNVSPQSTKQEISALRHSSRIFATVLAAITRQWHRTNNDETINLPAPLYVPFRDDTLTQALEPVLDKSDCTVYFWLHLDGSFLRPSSSELLQLAESLCSARFPNGRPPINFAALARQEHRVAVKLRQELADLRRQWEAERSVLESDRLMLRKAYEAASFSEKPLAITYATADSTSHRDPTSNRDRETLKMTKMMLSTCQREKLELEQSIAELRASNPNSSKVRLDQLSSAVDVLLAAGVVERSPSSDSVLCDAQRAICQLVQQLAERDKILGRVLPENDPSRKVLQVPGRWAQVASRLLQDSPPPELAAKGCRHDDPSIHRFALDSRSRRHEPSSELPSSEGMPSPSGRNRSNTHL